nr:aminopeptidase [uncultured Agathobacter sp.]
MSYKEIYKKTNQLYEERLVLVEDRIAQIADQPAVKEPFAQYFKDIAVCILKLKNFKKDSGFNKEFYSGFLKENYGKNYADPEYAVKMLGKDYGQILSAVYAKTADCVKTVFQGDIKYLCIYSELIVELYNYFEDSDDVNAAEINACVYSFMHDYEEIFSEDSIGKMLDPAYDYYARLVEDADVSKDDYLYEYGLYVGNNELMSRKYLASLTDEQIRSMADTYTEGYRIGFITCNKDITKKSVVQIHYPLGFERMVKAAIENFKKMGLSPVMMPYSTSVNKQYDYDHKEDMALWMDKAYVEYRNECLHNALEKNKDIACKCGGPAVIEIFGEEPFAPESKSENASYSNEQQKLSVYMTGRRSQLINQYIKGEERSFTIIAYPVSDIGDSYEEIFAETVKINTLDYILYRDMQQKIIDVLDTADRVHIVGTNGNKTDLYVKIHELENPDKETAFENCVADVNIPVGEVFTSPVLEKTEGKLHVSQVYLNELNFLNLEIDFKDGMIEKYTCTNFDDEEENQKYISDNILYHHKSLPMGEFAIGTNTTAYRMARVYDIAAKMPILIAEKTGPHFAVGDTCYTYDEDNMTYNPDGKAIVARDNSVSILRKEDISKAYFNCHTDITIPYDELGAITVIRHDGSTCDIIRDGRFVLPGTEELNKPLDELDAQNN